VLHADETPVAMLKPDNGKTHRAYLWAYDTGAFENTKAVVYGFCEGRAGKHARTFLGTRKGSLVCDDFSGYKALLAAGVTEVGCLAHALRKFFEPTRSRSPRERWSSRPAFLRTSMRSGSSAPSNVRQSGGRERSRCWTPCTNGRCSSGTRCPTDRPQSRHWTTALKRWAALIRFADDGQLPVHNNWIENQTRPIAIGRNNWLFAGSSRAGQWAAAVMSLIQSARMNRHDPWAYINDVLGRLQTQPNNLVAELLPHHWRPMTLVAWSLFRSRLRCLTLVRSSHRSRAVIQRSNERPARHFAQVRSTAGLEG
jgi:transposase